MDAVHRAKLLLLLADFAGVQSAVPAIVARYKVIVTHPALPFTHTGVGSIPPQLLQPLAQSTQVPYMYLHLHI